MIKENLAKWKISTFLNIFLSLTFLLAAAVTVAVTNYGMHRQALREAEAKARILLDRNLAIHSYFSRELKPKIFKWTEPFRTEDYFDPSWMSSTYAVRLIDRYFKELNPVPYNFKDAAVNARSPDNEADDLERAFLRKLSADPKLETEFVVDNIGGKPFLMVMRRGETMDPSCLRCHDRPEMAPAGLTAIYGNRRSFGRKDKEIVSAISIRIPLEAAYAEADRFSVRLSLLLSLALLTLFGTQYLLQRRFLLNPLRGLHEKTTQITTDENHLGETLPLPFGREFRQLTSNFNAMSASLKLGRDELEERVQARTRELASANDGLTREIRERHLVQEALRKEKEFAESLIQTAQTIILVLDTTGRIISFNPFMEDISGYRLEEVRGKDWFSTFIPERDRDRTRVLFATAISSIQTRGNIGLMMAKDGRELEIEWYDKTLKNAQGMVTGLLAIGLDITEREKMEEELLSVRKLESISLLAGGIAHDFNNILTGILGNISLARMLLKTDAAKTDERLVDSEKAALRATDLTQQLLTFAKGGAPVRILRDVKSLIEESARFATSGSGVAARLEIDGDLWPAEVDEGQIHQVVGNLVLNAVQVMPGGGTVIVRAGNVVVQEGELPSLKPGRYIRVAVQDQGPGIPSDLLDRIFDPFFTTKQKGSGLGLSAVYSIIRNHDGRITVESKAGAGSIFTFHLPASPKPAPKPAEAAGEIGHFNARILVMDDEPMVRGLAVEILQSVGCVARCAGDGREMLKMYREAKDAGEGYDLVIMDLTIPGGMGGKAAIKELLTLDPDAKAIVSSGYSNDPIMAEYREYGFTAVLVKPYRIKEVCAVLGDALGGGSSSTSTGN